MTTPEYISLIRLIQHPDEYHDKVIRVIGIARMKFEAKALYASKDDLEHAVTKNAIWLNVESDRLQKTLNQKHVIVEGVFDKDGMGHLKLYSGTIKDITRLEEWKANVND